MSLQSLKSESEDDATIKSPAHKPNFRIWKLQILQLAPHHCFAHSVVYVPPLAIKYAI